MHRGASCAKMVENYQDARWPRSAQGVMPLKVIAVLTPFGYGDFVITSFQGDPNVSGHDIQRTVVIVGDDRPSTELPGIHGADRSYVGELFLGELDNERPACLGQVPVIARGQVPGGVTDASQGIGRIHMDRHVSVGM